MKLIFYFAILFSAILSFIEASQFLDAHHDILLFLNSLFLYEGLIPYKDFYVQYGIIQPLITAFLFNITGVNLFTQNIVIIIAYSIFIIFNYKIIDIIINDKNVASFYGLLLIALEPFIILPWPNFLLGAFSSVGLYYIIRYSIGKDLNYLFIGNFFICLVPLIRSNAGLFFSILILLWSLYICIKSYKIINYLKLAMSATGMIIYFLLYFDDDFLKQSFVLPTKYLIPFYFQLPNDPISLLKLHYQLFFQEKNLSSVVSTTESLFFWRYVLIFGIVIIIFQNINNFFVSLFKRQKLINNNLIINNCLFLCGVSASSSVFPIFDSFRAINSWFPILLLLIVFGYNLFKKFNIAQNFKYILLVFILFFLYCNVSSQNVSILELTKRFDYRSFQFQFVNLSNFNEVSNYEDTIKEASNYEDKISNLGFFNTVHNLVFNTSSIKSSISAVDINPFKKYSKLSFDIKTHCEGKFFYSNSMDLMVYLSQHNLARLLPHKMFFSQSSVDKNGNFIDINYWLYPDFYESFNRKQSVCFFLSKSSHQFWLKNLLPFSQIIDYGDHILFIR